MKGISVYKRTGRPTYYVAYDCPTRLVRVNESTGYSIEDPAGRAKAYDYAKQKSGAFVAANGTKEAERWESWAEDFLRSRYATQRPTLTSYLGAWKFLQRWLHEAKIPVPRALTYQHLHEFVAWRTSQPRRSGKTTGRNTALHNVKVLSRLMREAIRRGFAGSNPCERLGDDLPPTPPKAKRELTDEDIATIRQAFAERKGKGRPSDWMPIAFEVALHQGCRLSATRIPMHKVDFRRGTVTLTEKGSRGEPTVFTIPIHPDIRPLLERLRDEGREYVADVPRFASRNFTRFLRSIGLDDVSFHCTRVTVITQMARSGVPIQQAMAYVHHADQTIHKVYQKLQAADLSACHQALSFGGRAKRQKSDAHAATSAPPPRSNSDR